MAHYTSGQSLAIRSLKQALREREPLGQQPRLNTGPGQCLEMAREVFVQHIAKGPSPFFNPETEGVKLHERVRATIGDAPIVVKQHADAFEGTTLHETLQSLGADELIICGMMTQNCVTHTAVSRRADEYQKATVLADASTTVSEMLHMIAVAGLSPRVTVSTVDTALA